MRKIMVCGLLLGGLAIAFSSQSCKGEAEPINSMCADFCDQLVDAMDDSDFYDLSYLGVSGTKKQCGQDCTEVVDEYKGLERGDMGDCVSCIADKGFNQIGGGDADVAEKDEWRMNDLPADIWGTDPTEADCDKECDREDIEYSSKDWLLVELFLQDFESDFVQHWSSAEPFCDGYNGDNLCCKESNPCAILDNNGNCECGGDCYWDDYDCSGGTGDVDVDSDADTDVSTDGCDMDTFTVCGEDYSTCVTDCGGDTLCQEECMATYCDCADVAGCWDYVSDYC